MYVGHLSLKYDVYAMGQTEDECKANIIKGFKQYMKSYRITFKEWLEELNEDYADYDNDMYTFLHEYYGVRIVNASKGYAIM